MQAVAVIFEQPQQLSLRPLDVTPPTAADVVVDMAWSGISTGTERLLYTGKMPPFPGLGYPLVPGYESVGTVTDAGAESGLKVGDTVFVPGASCFRDARGLFGGAAERVVTAGARVQKIDPALGDQGALLALAATAHHAIAAPGSSCPDLIIGHGVLGRLIARLTMAAGAPPPVVWETNPGRLSGATGYTVTNAALDNRRDYRAIYDASGSPDILDTLISRLAPGGEIVLAGFYADRVSFSFPPAFMREARFRIAAEWKRPDLELTARFIADGKLSLDGLITHRARALDAAEAYPVAFEDPTCLKMVLDWRRLS
jgi:bacteriochlorophyllide a dehydrogenase